MAAAEELLRLLGLGRSLSFTCATPWLLAGAGPQTRLEPSETDPPASVASAGEASTMAGSGGGKQACQAHCPAVMLCANVPRALQLGTFAPSALWRPCRACTPCPADRWLSCSGARCLHSGSRMFYMLLTLSYMDNPLGDSESTPQHTLPCSSTASSSCKATTHAALPSLARRPTLAGLPVGPPLMFATVQAGLGLYLQACRRPCRHCYHEPEASGFNAFVFCHSVSVTFRLLRDGMHTRPSSLLRGLHFARA